MSVYVLKKHGLYYAPNNCGYVSSPLMAEIYDYETAKAEAEMCDDITAIKFSDFGYTKEQINGYIERMDSMINSCSDAQPLNNGRVF